jgi:hypothetical protein
MLRVWEFVIRSAAGLKKWLPEEKFDGPVKIEIKRCTACGRNEWKKV